MVVLADLVLLVLFSLLMQIARVVFGRGKADAVESSCDSRGRSVAPSPSASWSARCSRSTCATSAAKSRWCCSASASVLSQVGSTQQFEPLLAAVAAGLVIENLAVAQGDTLRAAVQRGAPPVLVVFFVAVGASLRLDALAAIGYVALALSVGPARLHPHRPRVSGGRWRVSTSRIGKYAWTGSRLAGRHHARVCLRRRHRVSGVGQPDPVAARRARSPSTSSSDRSCSARDWRAPASSMRTSHARSWSSPTASRTCTREASDGQIVANAATGGVAIALDALMRERGGVWIAHGAGSADRLVVDAADHVRVPPESPSYTLRRLWLEEPTFSAYYGGFANEGPVAALPRRRRASEVPRRGLGGLPGHQRAVRRGRPRGARTRRRAGVHPGLSPGAGGAGTAGAAARRQDRALLAHPVALLRIDSASARGGASCSRGCSPTICSPSSWSATATTSCARSRRSWTPRSRPNRRASRFGGRSTTVVVGADRRRLRSHPGDSRPIRALPQEQQRLTELLDLRADDHRARRRSSRLHEGHPRAARRDRRADDAAPGAARQADVRPDWRAVAIGARELRGDRGGDRPGGRRRQRAPRDSRRSARRRVSQDGADERSAWSRSIVSPTSASSARCTTA